jgi:hypothetical protein
MRLARGVTVAVVTLALAGSASALPREQDGPRRSRERGVVQVVKKLVRALGDGLIVPLPKPLP